MSEQITFNTYKELIEYLRDYRNPVCFTVNYLPDTKEYDLDIGNQPYETSQRIISDMYQRNMKLMKALEFYASDISWLADDTGYSDIAKYGNKMAQEALASNRYTNKDLDFYKEIKDLKNKLKECEDRLDFFDCGL